MSAVPAEPKVYLNGQIRRLSQATIPITDYGFLYGVGVFETMRYYPGRGIFLLDAHLSRLEQGACASGIRLHRDEIEALREAATTLVLENHQGEDAIVKLIVSAGRGPLRPNPAGCDQPSTLILTIPYTPVRRAYRLATAPSPYTGAGLIPRVKSLNYLPYLLARHAATQQQADEVLFVSQEGFLCEGAISNLFFLQDGVLHTPDIDLPLLNGITRQCVIQIAREVGLDCIEGHYTLDQLRRADEAFLTNSVVECAPVAFVDGQTLPLGNVLPRLQRQYRLKVESSC